MNTITNGQTKEVSHKEFYAALYADQRDIMPRIVGPWSDATGYLQEWTVVASRQVVGISTSGKLGQSVYKIAA